MALENMSSLDNCKEEDDVPLPGFRFHPTDEELVGFYLKRKVQNKSFSIELIKQVDIYKYDPWDLPKFNNVGDKEWYFFSRRGRKYRNSIRPNRVTGSGFWKATGIDKPIYSSSGHDCIIGLKKSLVYYRGSAGKGTSKTDWMMHEFRLPSGPDLKIHGSNNLDTKTNVAQEAEVWTLCRILKRENTYKKLNVPDWREVTSANISSTGPLMDASSKTCSMDSSDKNSIHINISFTTSANLKHEIEKKPYLYDIHNMANQQLPAHFSSTSTKSQAPASSITNSSSSLCGDINGLIEDAGEWEDLRSIVDYYSSAPTMNPFYL